MTPKAPTPDEKALPSLSPEETEAWLSRYRRHSRLYAWGFYFALLPVVFAIIWASMGELNEDVFWSLGFFAVVTLLLAFFSRRRETSCWTGQVRDKYIKVVKSTSRDGRTDSETAYYILEIVTSKGKTIRLRSPESVFEYFEVGDDLFKAPSLNWPEKATLSGDRRICPCCGAILQGVNASCERCGAPVPDHAVLRRFAGAG